MTASAQGTTERCPVCGSDRLALLSTCRRGDLIGYKVCVDHDRHIYIEWDKDEGVDIMSSNGRFSAVDISGAKAVLDSDKKITMNIDMACQLMNQMSAQISVMRKDLNELMGECKNSVGVDSV